MHPCPLGPAPAPHLSPCPPAPLPAPGAQSVTSRPSPWHLRGLPGQGATGRALEGGRDAQPELPDTEPHLALLHPALLPAQPGPGGRDDGAWMGWSPPKPIMSLPCPPPSRCWTYGVGGAAVSHPGQEPLCRQGRCRAPQTLSRALPPEDTSTHVLLGHQPRREDGRVPAACCCSSVCRTRPHVQPLGPFPSLEEALRAVGRVVPLRPPKEGALAWHSARQAGREGWPPQRHVPRLHPSTSG